ncbi:hypothetical protein ABT034_27060, partial [Streptomyces sp. NPDC002773]
MYVTLIALAALWGAAVGLLVPRAAYRLAVASERNSHVLEAVYAGDLGIPQLCRADLDVADDQ